MGTKYSVDLAREISQLIHLVDKTQHSPTSKREALSMRSRLLLTMRFSHFKNSIALLYRVGEFSVNLK
ncbi:MAG: hypothetical protein HC763_08105 [Hydrococcus sp. CRU_1_1]|nr:hypothetical protein [Hydrococcus sp. CRU_1_1]NJQ98347.1 hypothetical protein [Hydrococcus sp. CSU_1_8]